MFSVRRPTLCTLICVAMATSLTIPGENLSRDLHGYSFSDTDTAAVTLVEKSLQSTHDILERGPTKATDLGALHNTKEILERTGGSPGVGSSSGVGNLGAAAGASAHGYSVQTLSHLDFVGTSYIAYMTMSAAQLTAELKKIHAIPENGQSQSPFRTY